MHHQWQWLIGFNITAPVKVTLAALVEELVEVVDWFHLGLYLEVPEHELKEIRCDYPDVKQRKTQALSVWMKMKEASWSQIVRALVAIRMKTLARHIATKYGKCTYEYAVFSVF